MRPAHPPSSSTVTPPSRASPLPHWIFSSHKLRVHPESFCASLLAMRPAHPTSSLTVTPPSRASPLPHWIFSSHNIRVHPESFCGSELAREEASTSSLFIDCNPAFASKLAPTLDLQQPQYPCAPGVLLWGSLLAKRQAHPPSSLTVTPPSRASPLPQKKRDTTKNQVGYQAASFRTLISGAPLTTLAERRHCGVGIPAWMPG